MGEDSDPGARRPPPDLDKLIEDITLDTCGDDEKFSAFLQAFEDSIFVPCDGFVIGEPVLIVTFDYDGNERRGLTARCRREVRSKTTWKDQRDVTPWQRKRSN